MLWRTLRPPPHPRQCRVTALTASLAAGLKTEGPRRDHPPLPGSRSRPPAGRGCGQPSDTTESSGLSRPGRGDTSPRPGGAGAAACPALPAPAPLPPALPGSGCGCGSGWTRRRQDPAGGRSLRPAPPGPARGGRQGRGDGGRGGRKRGRRGRAGPGEPLFCTGEKLVPPRRECSGTREAPGGHCRA